MKELMTLVRREPVLLHAMIQAFLAMLMGFGLNMTKEQMTLVMMFVGSVTAFITRSQVTSNPEVAKQVEVALNTPAPEKTIT